MKAKDIKVGGRYTAKVNGNLVTVRVDAIRDWGAPSVGTGKRYDVTNLATGRRTTFRSAAKFREEVRQPSSSEVFGELGKVAEAEQRPDPTLRPRLTSSVQSAVVTADLTTATGSPSTQPTPSDQPTERVPRASIAAKLAEARAARTTAGQDTAPHLIVLARAGTGKTTTLVEGLRVLKGIAPRIDPSPQQRAVWDSLLLSQGKVSTIGFVAFNRSIARELQERVPAGVEAMTMHSLGNKAVCAAFGRVALAEWRVRDILADLMGMDGRRMQKDHPVLVKAVEELVGLCKMNLVGHVNGTGLSEYNNEIWDKVLSDLARHYDVDLNGQKERAFALVPQVLDRCRDVRRDNRMDYNDMIWLPVVLNLPVRKFDLLLVDEAQDLNRCQQALAKMTGRRLVLVGDDRQAIYGFAGADSNSLPRMEKELTATDRSCTTLPLTVTRRCGKAIVAEAKRYVPDFEAHEANPEGQISEAVYPGKRTSKTTDADIEIKWEDSYAAWVADGDFVLCRTNAPLVSQCFAFIKRGMRANIQGRDIGAGLTGLVKKLEGKDEGGIPVAEFVRRLDDWFAAETNKEQAKRNPSETRLQGLADRYGCLMAFTDGAYRSIDVKQKIDAVFTDDKEIRGIRLSSVHRAKGLEARRVFWLRSDGSRQFGPPPDRLQAWERGQEENLAYVAVTRAIEELVMVS